MKPNQLHRFLTFVLIISVLTPSASATEPIRIWVDVSGRFSIRARLIDLKADSVSLLRDTGETITIARGRLSKRDRSYLEEIDEALSAEPNALRLEAPKLPDPVPLPVLDLPAATHEVDEGAALILERSKIKPRLEPPEVIQPDASPLTPEISETRIPLPRLGSYDVASRAIPVSAQTSPLESKTSTETPDSPIGSLGISIASGLTMPGQTAKGRLIRFDAEAKKHVVVWKGADNIRLFDHHLPSGRSLVLIGYSPVGHGGELAIATGWNRDAGPDGNAIRISHRRTLPDAEQAGRLQRARWARWIDEEHVVVMLNGSLVAWNLISGEQLFRIENVTEEGEAALSAGRRYLAVPGIGYVDIYSTADGRAMGRIPADPKSITSLSFSPRGDALALVNNRQLRVWDLASASVRSEVNSRRSLGKDSPLWIDDDLVMSSSGVLISLFRGIPVWRYELTACKSVSCPPNVAVIRKYPEPELDVVRLPHPGAVEAMKWIDTGPSRESADQWRIPGRSVWAEGDWQDRDVRLSLRGISFR